MNLQDLEVITPGYSIEDLSHTNTLSVPLGKVFPVLIEFVHPGESIEMDFDWLCRTLPMNAPLMDNMEIAFDAFWVPARTIGIAGDKHVGYSFEDFYNPMNLQSGSQLPSTSISAIVQRIVAKEGRLDGTLYDYLGYPTFPQAWRKLTENLNSIRINVLTTTSGSLSWNLPFVGFATDVVSNVLYANYWIPEFYKWSSGTDDVTLSSSTIIPPLSSDFVSQTAESATSEASFLVYCSFTGWLLRKYFDLLVATTNNMRWRALVAIVNTTDDVFGYICNFLKTDPSVLYDQWRAWLFSDQPVEEAYSSRSATDSWIDLFIEDTDGNTGWTALVPNIDKEVSIVPFLVYEKIINDWYVNPLLVDGDQEYLDLAYDIVNYPYKVCYLELQNRLYGFDDAFVTATATGDQPNVLLPDSPGVKDIRNASRLQIFLERVMKTGKRYMDQILTTFGIQPNNQRLDRSEVLFRRTAFLDMQAVTQTNQAELNGLLNSPIGSQFGQSLSFQSFAGNTITFDEHGYYVVLASIRPRASYMQGLSKHLTGLSADDFIVPDFAQIGDDVVTNQEVYFDFRSSDGNFGYNQRYYQYMWHPSEVHGLMLNELDYYHLARRFDSQPSLSTDFTSVDIDQNDLSRIFTAYDNTPFLMWINFKEKMLRPLPTSSTYEL